MSVFKKTERHHSNLQIKFISVGFVFLMQFLLFLDVVQAMSSDNYKVIGDTVSIGGARSTSEVYVAEDTLGEMATGEDLSSTNYSGCAGFQCVEGTPYISFSVMEGLSKPGAVGAGVSLGTLDTSSVTTSDGSSVNSIFILTETSAGSGLSVSVTSSNSGLARISTADIISSATDSLVAGTEGYGICVFSVDDNADTPTAFGSVAPYNGACDKINNHDVGIVDGTARSVLSSTGEMTGGDAEILVKASISAISPGGNDYADTLTFIATGTY